MSLLNFLIIQARLLVFTIFILLFCFNLSALASTSDTSTTNLATQPAIETVVHLSNINNELKFIPERIDFVVGKRYKLVLDNPSNQKHYFTAKDFADVIWTQKIEAGNVEIKGAIHEVELKPGAKAEWFFVPIKPGNYNLRCPIAGHTEAGMTGKISILEKSRIQNPAAINNQ